MLEEEPAVATVMEAAARFDVETGVAQGRRRVLLLQGLVAASRRFSASLLDRSRFRTVGIVVATNLVSSAAVPTSSIYGTARRGPTSHLLGWASPIRTRVKGPVRRWANWWRSILTFSPLISPYTFKLLNLNLTLYFSLLALLSVLISLQIGT